MKFFSIVVPVYNVEKYIERSIQSVVSQTFDNWELLLVDDGSTDASSEICRRYAATDKRIQVFCKENSGAADTRNYGVDMAGGQYLLFLDSDDSIMDLALDTLYKECVEQNMPDVILSEGGYLYDGETARERKNYSRDEYKGITGRNAVLKTMQIAPNWAVFGKCFRLDFWRTHAFRFPVRDMWGGGKIWKLWTE